MSDSNKIHAVTVHQAGGTYAATGFLEGILFLGVIVYWKITDIFTI